MELTIIKLSGALLDESTTWDALARWKKNNPTPLIIVHGAGIHLDTYCQEQHISIDKVHGRRVTTTETRDAMEKIVAGTLNEKAVGELNQRGLSAIGMNGGTEQCIVSKKRPPVVYDGISVDFGLVGDINSVNVPFLARVIEQGHIPVIACMTYNHEFGLLNTNADDVAIAIAQHAKAERLHFLSNITGVFDENGVVLSSMTASLVAQGIEQQWIKDGMIPKVQAALKAVQAGVKTVVITSPDQLNEGNGTQFTS